jgi:hypothetical protein
MSPQHGSTRWWIASPGPDETFRSLLDRAAALYECDPSALWDELHQNTAAPGGGIDNPTAGELLRLSRAMGVSSVDLQLHRMPDAPWRLSPEARKNYCPQCRSDELRVGLPATLQCGWTFVLRTHCPLHNVPLCLAQYGNRKARTTDFREASQLSSSALAILSLIEAFGVALEGSLFRGEPWPSDWRGDARRARALLLRVSFNSGTERTHLPLASVCPPAELEGFVHGPRHLADPAPRVDWEGFRALADPAVRRAALWVAAWAVVPQLGADFCPGWVDVAV